MQKDLKPIEGSASTTRKVGLPPPPPPVELVQVLSNQTLLMEAIFNVVKRPRPQVLGMNEKLIEFLRMKPPTFGGSVNLLDVDDWLLMDKRRISLRPASVQTYTFFTTGFPRFLSIRGARGLQAFDLPLHTSYSKPNYD
jgi:hypothetical protein